MFSYADGVLAQRRSNYIAVVCHPLLACLEGAGFADCHLTTRVSGDRGHAAVVDGVWRTFQDV